jgi:hypothetical protein
VMAPCDASTLPGITLSFPRLSQTRGYVTHALLPLSPLTSELPRRFVRLACLIHAANVRSEPGSNPSKMLASDRAEAPSCQPEAVTQGNRARENELARSSLIIASLSLTPRTRRPATCETVRHHTSYIGLCLVLPNCQRSTRKPGTFPDLSTWKGFPVLGEAHRLASQVCNNR